MLAAADGDVAVLRAGRRLDARPGLRLEAGDVIRPEKDARAEIGWAGEATRVTLAGGAEASVGDASAGKRIDLNRGALEAVVAPQPERRPLAFHTPQAVATVLGTRLRLAVASGATRLDVAEGRVRLLRRSDRKSVEVGAGRFAVAGGGAELAAQRDWRPLFNGTDLSGWRVARGRWSVEGGVLAADESAGTACQLESEEAFEDFELSLKARSDRADNLWVQIRGGAARFVLPPDREEGWREVRIVARGRTAQGTIDGRPLPSEAGDPSPHARGRTLLLRAFLGSRGHFKDIRIRELE
jgi:hypothetical protein